MNESELAEIEERAGRATPGPWRVGKWDGLVGGFEVLAGTDRLVATTGRSVLGDGTYVQACDAMPNASLIAAAPALLAEVKRLREWLDVLRDSSEWLACLGMEAPELPPCNCGPCRALRGESVEP